MTRIYRYILPHDTGMAPCAEGGFISLATCKPVIRRVARAGDWVLGFRPGSMERGLLLWAGKVDQIVSHGDYQRAYPRRSDAVYRELHDGDHERLLAGYHATQREMERDLSSPVLLFERSSGLYLHGQPLQLPAELAHLAAAGQGHRVNGTTAQDVAVLETWLTGHKRPNPRLSEGSAPKTKVLCARRARPQERPDLW